MISIVKRNGEGWVCWWRCIKNLLFFVSGEGEWEGEEGGQRGLYSRILNTTIKNVRKNSMFLFFIIFMAFINHILFLFLKHWQMKALTFFFLCYIYPSLIVGNKVRNKITISSSSLLSLLDFIIIKTLLFLIYCSAPNLYQKSLLNSGGYILLMKYL